jgi:hypothetical protein
MLFFSSLFSFYKFCFEYNSVGIFHSKHQNMTLTNSVLISIKIKLLIQHGFSSMGGSVLSFLKAEWKVSDTGSAHWASS